MCFLYNFFRKKKTNIVIESVSNKILNNEDECSICLEQLNNYKCVQMKNCNHFFHYKCYNEYINSKNVLANGKIYCPYCYTFQKNIK